jgi:RimJ/RimL family protein N-acetyltransferase
VKSEGHKDVTLRDIEEPDLPILFEHQVDPVSVAMAAFEPREREPFMEHWAKILENPEVTKKAILLGDEVVGDILRFRRGGLEEVGYWIEREHWGKGIASRALSLFLAIEPIRPLYAIVAEHNTASLRVLEKSGFILIDRDYQTDELSGPDVVDYLLELPA